MVVIGVDVAKSSVVAVRMSSGGLTKASFELENSEEVLGAWLDKLQNRYSHLVVASEATGDYHNTLAKCCLSRGVEYRLMNPILTKQFNRGTVRKKKTDLTDAEVIARLVLQGEGYLIDGSLFSPARAIHRTGIRLTKVKQILERMSVRFEEFYPEEQEAAAWLRQCMQALEATSSFMHQRAAAGTDQHLLNLLTSITGVGEHVATTLINEIGDIKRFPSAKQLIAYTGLDPRVKQSGTSLKHNTHLTKRGSVYLRRDVFIAASIARQWDPELREYYQKKIGEGKRYREATVATARKLLNRVYAVWKRETPYEKRPLTT